MGRRSLRDRCYGAVQCGLVPDDVSALPICECVEDAGPYLGRETPDDLDEPGDDQDFGAVLRQAGPASKQILPVSPGAPNEGCRPRNIEENDLVRCVEDRSRHAVDDPARRGDQFGFTIPSPVRGTLPPARLPDDLVKAVDRQAQACAKPRGQGGLSAPGITGDEDPGHWPGVGPRPPDPPAEAQAFCRSMTMTAVRETSTRNGSGRAGSMMVSSDASIDG